MPIKVITGLPGSGKTTRVIEIVETLRKENAPVLLFMCADAPQFGPTSSARVYGAISSRAGKSTKIDHFLGGSDTKCVLEKLSSKISYTLIFDEAQYYGLAFTETWLRMAKDGHTVILSTLTPPQIKIVESEMTSIEKLETECALLLDGPATQFFVLPGKKITLSVCDTCAAVLRQRAKEAISKLLIDQEPYPGESRVYQPIDLPIPEFTSLASIREDSATRAALMAEHVKARLGDFGHRTRSYLDVGCNTGYFCKKMADIGFVSRGVDVVPGDIRVAGLLDLYFYRRYMDFICKDAVAFLREDDQEYDIVSTYSVFQWIYIQQPKEAVDEAIYRLFKKAKTLVFFEMGYTEEKHYKGRLQEEINREWCLRKMSESNLFSEIITYEQGQKNLKRDFFVGVRKQTS